MKKTIVLITCLAIPFLITSVDFFLCSVFDRKGTSGFTLFVLVMSSFIPVYLITYISALKWKILFSVFIVPVYVFLTFWLFEILAMFSGHTVM
jgi:hypothetical protein